MKKIDHTWFTRPPGTPESLAAGGVIARWERDRLLIALVREADYPDYILPKGSVEAGENPEITARREIEEEAGLTSLTLLGELGIRERLDFRKRNWKKTYYYLFYTDQQITIPTDPHHVYRCEWFPVDRLPSMFWPEQSELIKTNQEKILSLAQRFHSA